MFTSARPHTQGGIDSVLLHDLGLANRVDNKPMYFRINAQRLHMQMSG